MSTGHLLPAGSVPTLPIMIPAFLSAQGHRTVDCGFSTGVPGPRAGSLGHVTQQRAPPATGSTHPQVPVTSGQGSLQFWDVFLSHGPDHASWSGTVFSVTSVTPLTRNIQACSVNVRSSEQEEEGSGRLRGPGMRTGRQVESSKREARLLQI